MQPLVRETKGSNLRNWTTLSLPGIRLLRGEQCELRDLWVTGKGDHGFVRCEGAALCPYGGNDTNLLGNKMYFLIEVG